MISQLIKRLPPAIHFFMPLFCRSWIALTSFRRERGLIVFFPFLKFLIAHSASAALRESLLVENSFACGRISSRYFASTTRSFPAPRELQFSEVFQVGDGIAPPKAIFTPSPEYSKEARAVNYQGVCVLSLIVGPDGMPYNIRVSRPLDFGLNEKAIDCVKKWRFAPSTKDGKPVAVAVNVEVTFRLSR